MATMTREDVVSASSIAMDDLDKLRIIFSAIVRLCPDGEAKGLASMGKRIADEIHNDIDVLHERAEKSDADRPH